jgi:hypothetical protein
MLLLAMAYMLLAMAYMLLAMAYMLLAMDYMLVWPRRMSSLKVGLMKARASATWAR